MIDFSEKCEVLGQLIIDSDYIGRIPPELVDFVNEDNFILNLAWCIKMKYAEPNNKTIELIDNSYRTYLELLGK